jgi:hypothetical protein
MVRKAEAIIEEETKRRRRLTPRSAWALIGIYAFVAPRPKAVVHGASGRRTSRRRPSPHSFRSAPPRPQRSAYLRTTIQFSPLAFMREQAFSAESRDNGPACTR